MREIHRGLPYRNFVRPGSGIIEVTVCAKSGLLRNSACNEGEITLPFLEGTQPVQYCNIHGNASYPSAGALSRPGSGILGIDDDELLGSLTMPVLSPELFPEPRETRPGRNRASGRGSRGNSGASGGPANRPVQDSLSWSFNDAVSFPDESSGEEERETPPETRNGDLTDPDNEPELPAYNPLLD
jgi:penicillin-binding protein 1A